MKQARTHIIALMVHAVLLTAVIALHVTSSTKFLARVEATDVAEITVFDGGTGREFTVTDPEDIARIVENIRSTTVERDGIAVGYMGYGFRMTFTGTDGQSLGALTLNSADTIRTRWYFYRSAGETLCYDLIDELELRAVSGTDTLEAENPVTTDQPAETTLPATETRLTEETMPAPAKIPQHLLKLSYAPRYSRGERIVIDAAYCESTGVTGTAYYELADHSVAAPSLTVEVFDEEHMMFVTDERFVVNGQTGSYCKSFDEMSESALYCADPADLTQWQHEPLELDLSAYPVGSVLRVQLRFGGLVPASEDGTETLRTGMDCNLYFSIHEDEILVSEEDFTESVLRTPLDPENLPLLLLSLSCKPFYPTGEQVLIDAAYCSTEKAADREFIGLVNGLKISNESEADEAQVIINGERGRCEYSCSGEELHNMCLPADTAYDNYAAYQHKSVALDLSEYPVGSNVTVKFSFVGIAAPLDPARDSYDVLTTVRELHFTVEENGIAVSLQ